MVEEMSFRVFHIISLWELYVAMTTISSTLSDIKLIQPFPLSDDAVHMQFGHNWPSDIRDIFLYNVIGWRRRKPCGKGTSPLPYQSLT